MDILKGDPTQVICSFFNKAESGFICTPFFTERGLSIFKRFFNTSHQLEFWTRLNVIDWAQGLTDLPALAKILLAFHKRDSEASLFIYDNLHAKVYVADNKCSFIGSTNLTSKGLTNNLEILVRFDEEETVKVLKWIKDERRKMVPIGINSFVTYIDTVYDAIQKYPKTVPSLDTKEAEDINAAIDLAESLLITETAEITGRKLYETKIDREFEKISTLDEFIHYCKSIQKRGSDAKEVVDRYNGKHNLQGHVKHCYYGSSLFLLENPKFIDKITSWRDGEEIKLSNEPWIEFFKSYLKRNTNYFNEDKHFSFHTFRVYLPESIGGITVGGGGGIGTFRRVLRLSALMMKQNRIVED